MFTYFQSYSTCCGVHFETLESQWLCVYVFCTERGSVFGNRPDYEGDSAQYSWKSVMLGLMGNLSSTHQSQPKLGRDRVSELLRN